MVMLSHSMLSFILLGQVVSCREELMGIPKTFGDKRASENNIPAVPYHSPLTKPGVKYWFLIFQNQKAI